jgi:diketogulonate reductase-like aldo/keto reductase
MSLPLVHANGAAIPPIGLGTSRVLGEECVRTIAAALQAGYRFIDTAARYENEEAVGEGIRASGVPRSEVFLLTKVYWTHLAATDFERSTEESLKRLGVDQVDLLLIHWPNPKVPLAETVGALNRMHRRGLARHIGVANFTTNLIEQAVRLSEAPLVANQCEYHPYLDQSKVLAACRHHGMAFMSYSPLRQSGPDSPLADPAIIQIAEAKGVTPAQVVLRWHIQQPGVIALPRSTNPLRLRQNIDLGGFSLTETEMNRISALAQPNGRKISPAHSPVWDA